MSLDQSLIRQEYGFLQDMTHVNVCSVGVPPLRTQRASANFMADSYLAFTYDSVNLGYSGMRQHVREQIAQLIHADPREIAFTKSTSEGMSILASGYPLKDEDNVVVCDLDNSAVLYPWINASRARSFQVKLVKTNGRGVQTEDFIRAVDAHTKVIAVSAVLAGTGCRIDLEKLGAFCRERGILFAVDGIQMLGRLDLNVQSCYVDFLSCGGFKGLLSGFGIGFLWCRSDLIPKIHPPCAGSDCAEFDPTPPAVLERVEDFQLREDALRFEVSTSNTQGIAMMEQSLGLILELGIQRIQQNVLSLEKLLRELIADIPLDVLPVNEKPSGMLVAYCDASRYEQTEEMLKKHNVHLTHRPGYLRLSIGIHNTDRDIQMIADALHEIGSLQHR